MPKEMQILSQKYYNQFKNGSDFSLLPLDFTNNLTGNVAEKIKVAIQLELQWYANADLIDTWTVAATSINRSSGNFRNDGFAVGHTFDYITGWVADNSTPIEFNATITSISTDGSGINFTVNSGAPVPGSFTDEGIRAVAASNMIEALSYDFGIIYNNESFNNTSKVSDNMQTYEIDSIPRPTSFVDMVPLGFQDWVSGVAKVAFNSETTYTQIFDIEHEFIINPFYLESDFQLSLDGSYLLPSWFNAFIKYSFNPKFRLSLSDLSTEVEQVFDTDLGKVSYFDSNFNAKQQGAYTVDSISYKDKATTDSVLGLQDADATITEIRISKAAASFTVGQRAGLVLFYLPTQSEYQDTATDIESNFVFDSIYHNEGAVISTGTGIIKSLYSTLDSGDLVLTAEIDYTLAEGQKIEGGQYFIGVQIGDSILSSKQTDRLILRADIGAFQPKNIIPLACTFDTILFYEHNKAYVSGTGASSLNLWNEDGVLIEIPFALDLAYSTKINGLKVILSAYNTVTNESFELDSFRFEASSSVVSLGVQQIAIKGSRGYPLGLGSQFNDASISIGTKVGTVQNYTCLIGQKISWQDWIQNLEADTIFYDAAKSNDNLNDKSSNYSDLNDYEIRAVIEADIEAVNSLGSNITGTSETTSGNLNINDYGKDGNITPIWGLEIKTYDSETLADLGGNILSTKDTLFECRWTNSVAPLTTTANQYIIHRIETFNDASYQINELSTINANQSDNILKSTDSSGLVQVSLDSGVLVSQCLIDYTKLNPELNYNLSGRLKK